MTNLPQERPLVFNLSTPPSSTRRKITDENFTSLPRTKRTNEISLEENRGGEWRSVERNKSRSSRSVGHFVDETCRNHDSSSPFTNCKGAANMRDWNFAKQPHERSFCERVPPPVKETFGQEFKKETCRSEPPRCATRYEKHGAERFERSWILERDEKHDAETGALGTGSIICHWTWTDRFSINSKHRRRNNPIFVHNDQRIATLAR